jgi:hypothetical protein
MSKEKEIQELYDRIKNSDPDFDLRVEYGTLLMKHINDFTPEERKRYDELTKYFEPETK